MIKKEINIFRVELLGTDFDHVHAMFCSIYGSHFLKVLDVSEILRRYVDGLAGPYFTKVMFSTYYSSGRVLATLGFCKGCIILR